MKMQKKLVSYLCIFVLLLTMTPMTAFAGQTSDVANHWASSQINSLMDSGIITGYKDGTFRPDNNITRAEFMAMVNRAFNYSEKADANYKDVPAGAWYADIIKQANAAGYIGGYTDGTMKPNNYITRQEVASIIAKIKNLTGNADTAAGFKDASNIPAWSKGAIGAIVDAQIMGGYPDGSFKAGNNITRAEAAVVLDKALMKPELPNIGISWLEDINKDEHSIDLQVYINAVKQAGGNPVLLPLFENESQVKEALDTIDGLVLTGGGDFDPSYYNQKPDPKLETGDPVRDKSDYMLLKAALEEKMPVLAICRGFQWLNVICGGTLYQDIPTLYKTNILHRSVDQVDFVYHDINISAGSQLADIMGAGKLNVNSWHHQAVKDVGTGLKVVATAGDGIVEAVEKEDAPFVMGLQFHPEWHLDAGDTQFLAIYKKLVQYSSGSIVLKNGAIYTMDAKDTVAAAIAAVGDEIVYVGNDAGAEKYIGKNTKVIDLKGQMVTPGFVDGHCHPTLAPIPDILYLEDVEPTIEAYQAAIKDYVASHPDLKVIRGEGLQIKVFSDAVPKASMIDAVVSDKPVLIWDTAEHGLLLNTAALKAANITKDTAAPAGGEIYKDAAGNPTGYLSDASSLTDVIPDDTPAPTEQERIDAFKGFQTEMNGYGITSVDGGGSEADVYKAMDDFSKSGEMTMRVNLPFMAAGFTPADAIEAVKVLNENQKYNSDYQHVSQVKQIIDGVPEGKTVLLMEPYPPEAGLAADFKGPQYCTQDELKQFAAIIDKAGYQVFIHAMGDGGANECINAYEYAQQQNGKRDARDTIVHANFIDQSDMVRMGKDGIYAALQPIWAYFDPTFSALEKQNLGAERFAEEYHIKDMVNDGVMISASADWSVSDNRPLFGIETGVTQCSPYPGEQGDPAYLRNPAQGVSVLDMLKFYTINGAKQMFMEDKIGSLEVGKKADMVVLEKDITKIAPEDISETTIEDTIFNGKIVYSN